MATATATRTTVRKAASPEVIFAEASAAELAAFEAASPTPMIVGSARVPLFDDSIDPTKPVYQIADGACGMAWVTIRPARGALVTWLKQKGIGRIGYYGGWEVRSWQFGAGRYSQSYERAYAAADAAARVLASYGIKAYADGRLD